MKMATAYYLYVYIRVGRLLSQGKSKDIGQLNRVRHLGEVSDWV